MSDLSPLPPPVYATFVGEINQGTVRQLTTQLCIASQQNAPSVHLLIQSTGGAVADGVYLHNFMKTFPIPIVAYNAGSVCSAAVVAFLGASIRKSSRFGSFMIHRPQSTAQGADLALLEAATASLKLDDLRMDTILKEHLTLSDPQWEMYDRHPLWIGADDALAAGLTTAIGEFSPPQGATIYAFGLA
jgi:ATP-dependent Clp protease protease subunit